MNDDSHSTDCLCCNGVSPNDIHAMIQEGIDKVGFAIVPVSGGEKKRPLFAYTVGLTKAGLPELIIDGDFQQQLINILGMSADHLLANRDAFNGTEVSGIIQVMVHGKLVDGVLGCRPVTKENRLEHMGWARARYGVEGFTANQIVVPDLHGKLPWHDGFNQAWGIKSCQRALYEADENGK